MIRLHPRLLEKSNTFIQYNEKIIDGTKIEDIQELLAITDLLITDYSSIALDYQYKLNDFINEFKFFDDGTASQKIVKLICKLIEDK